MNETLSPSAAPGEKCRPQLVTGSYSGNGGSRIDDSGNGGSHIDDSGNGGSRIDDSGNGGSRIDDSGNGGSRIDDSRNGGSRIDDSRNDWIQLLHAQTGMLFTESFVLHHPSSYHHGRVGW